LTATLTALVNAGDHGLDPADYDAALLPEQWTAFKSGRIAGADRALFDLAVSVAVARLVKAVQVGRVDPATMYWDYDVSSKRVDYASSLRAARDGEGLAATLDKISPAVHHYARARRMLAVYKARARAGEPEVVPLCRKGEQKLNRERAGLPSRKWRRGCAHSAIWPRTRPFQGMSPPQRSWRPSSAFRSGTAFSATA
jgi:murein L,D-transpeptidase YcbB/YkuD